MNSSTKAVWIRYFCHIFFQIRLVLPLHCGVGIYQQLHQPFQIQHRWLSFDCHPRRIISHSFESLYQPFHLRRQVPRVPAGRQTSAVQEHSDGVACCRSHHDVDSSNICRRRRLLERSSSGLCSPSGENGIVVYLTVDEIQWRSFIFCQPQADHSIWACVAFVPSLMRSSYILICGGTGSILRPRNVKKYRVLFRAEKYFKAMRLGPGLVIT